MVDLRFGPFQSLYDLCGDPISRMLSARESLPIPASPSISLGEMVAEIEEKKRKEKIPLKPKLVNAKGENDYLSKMKSMNICCFAYWLSNERMKSLNQTSL